MVLLIYFNANLIFIVDDDEMDFYDDDNKLITEKPKKTKKATASSTGDKPKSNYFQFMNRAGPVALGSKEVPSGPPECLLGKTFVVTGIPPSITREDMEDLIKRHGGRVTSAVSGKTSFLVVGNEPGQTKVDKAKKMKTPQIDEDGLFDMISSANGANGSSEAASAPAAPAPAPKKEAKPVVKSEPSIKLEDKPAITPARNYSWMQPDSKSKPESKVSEMWVDKYKPKSISEVVGNNTNVQDIIRYLRDFDPNQPYTTSNTRAVLITGPPGIGKTTAAHLACKETGYDALEFNASDVRNKAAIQQKIGTASSNHSITSFFGVGNKKPETKRLALILDEIDGMSGGDRGGVQEVIKMIKTTKVPIICIANDRMNTKVRSLANYCKDLKFNR
jgi:replication factor C subunit 1